MRPDRATPLRDFDSLPITKTWIPDPFPRRERNRVALLRKQSESFDQCFSSSSTGEKKRGGIEETMESMNAKRRTVFSFSFSLFVSFSLTSHSLFVVIRKKSKRIDRNARNDSFLVPFFSSSSFSSIILTEASSKSVTRVPGRFRTARPTRVYAWCNV